MKKFTKKSLVLLAAAALLLTISVSGTVAYLMAGTNPVVNSFTPGKVDTKIEEVVEGNTKKSIKVEHNTGTIDVYVRVALVGNWIDVNGRVIAPWNPNQGDFVLNTEGWVQGRDGYYYHKTKLSPGEQTADLLEKPILITANDMQVGAKELVLSVVHQSIQAQPTSAVKDAWGVNLDPTTGNITGK